MSICGTFSMSGITNGDEGKVAAAYQSTTPPPTSVTSAQQPDGTWTVTAQWPPCPAGVKVVHSANNL